MVNNWWFLSFLPCFVDGDQLPQGQIGVKATVSSPGAASLHRPKLGSNSSSDQSTPSSSTETGSYLPSVTIICASLSLLLSSKGCCLILFWSFIKTNACSLLFATEYTAANFIVNCNYGIINLSNTSGNSFTLLKVKSSTWSLGYIPILLVTTENVCILIDNWLQKVNSSHSKRQNYNTFWISQNKAKFLIGRSRVWIPQLPMQEVWWGALNPPNG